MKVPLLSQAARYAADHHSELQEQNAIEQNDAFENTVLARKTSVLGQQGWFRLAGFAVVKGKELASPTVEQLLKLKELIVKSDGELYFLVQAAADNRIAQITSFGDKRKWIESLQEGGVAGWNSIFEGASANKEKQLQVLEKLISEARRDL